MSSIHPLNIMFEPRSVALIGVSRDPSNAGYGVLANMLGKTLYASANDQPFGGHLYVVNPKADEILGQKCYASLSALPEVVDLAVIMLPAKIVPVILEECGKCGVKRVVIISAGFSEVGNREAEDKLVAIAKQYGIRIIGPNCLGIINPHNRLNVSFAPATPKKGSMGFISQSGAIIDAVIDLATSREVGFSSIISIGNQCDVNLTELIEYLGQDKKTTAIIGYIESIPDGKAFIRVCQEVSKKKPILLIKSGRSAKGSLAAASHTGKLAGSFAIFEAACRQAGVILLNTIEQLFDVAEVLGIEQPLKKNAVAVITNAGGAGVLCTDYCEEAGLDLCELEPTTIESLSQSPIMNPHFSRRNPLDIVGDAGPDRYKLALEAVLKDPNVGGVIILQTLQTMSQPLETGKIIVEAKKNAKVPVVCAIIGGEYSRPQIEYLKEHHVAVYTEIRKAVQALKFLQYKKS